MKKRFLKWLYHKLHRYMAGTSKIVDAEAKRYCEYLVENYTELEQVFIVKDLQKHLILTREKQIEDKIQLLKKEEENKVLLEKNLEKLKNCI